MYARQFLKDPYPEVIQAARDVIRDCRCLKLLVFLARRGLSTSVTAGIGYYYKRKAILRYHQLMCNNLILCHFTAPLFVAELERAFSDEGGEN